MALCVLYGKEDSIAVVFGEGPFNDPAKHLL